MGYDLELVGDPAVVRDREELVRRLCEAGAEVHYDQTSPTFPEPVIHWPGLGHGIWLNRSERALWEGRWATLRAPGTEDGLRALLAFAERADCRVYDPQEKVYVTEETLGVVQTGREKFARVVASLFGTAWPARRRNREESS